MKVAFIGLGVMGYPMAGHLKNAGLDVCVYNRTEAKASQWCVEHGGNSAPTPREAAENCDIVFTCVGNDDDVRQVIFGDDAAFAGMKPGAILVDHTTASASLARELDAAAREQGFSFLDAPVSGGQAGAQIAGSSWKWPIGKDGKSGLYCRRGSGSGRRIKFCQECRAGWRSTD